jgi:hypothetical protein
VLDVRQRHGQARDRQLGTRITHLATNASIEIYGTATLDATSPDKPADPIGLLVIASDGRYAGDAAGLALVRVRTATDVRSPMAAPTVTPDAAKAVALIEDFVATCK